MPQELTGKAAAAAQRAQDKEAKRARGALSCAECRRLKLKCDKTVPCSSCVRRGCGSICPNEELVTGGGTRFVLANTERLHKKIEEMGDRIQALEDALRISHSSQSSDTHPLLSRDLLTIKSAIDLHSAVKKEKAPSQPPPDDSSDIQGIDDTFGLMAIYPETGVSSFYGWSAGSESLLVKENMLSPVLAHRSPVPSNAGSSRSNIPDMVSSLSDSFPFNSTAGTLADIKSFVPLWREALHYSRLYLSIGPWFYGALTAEQLENELLPMWYPAESHKASSSSPGSSQSSDNTGDPKTGGAHDLALLFIVLCFGALTDTALPPAPDNTEAEKYYLLARAAINLEPPTDNPPSLATVQTLSMMGIYQGLCNGENNIESMWTIYGLSTKLAQSIGLHKDSARWKLSPREVQKRRGLFWELFITDCWQALSTGRLATFSRPFVDCELPQDTGETLDADGKPQPSFPFWKAKFGAECVSAIVQGTLTARAPKYSVIIELDRKVRDMELPRYARGEPPRGLPLDGTMSYFMPHNYRDLSLLYIHRCFFTHALISHPLDPLKSQYAPSFLAGYRSSCDLIANVRTSFSMFPAEIARFWVLWTHAFSGAVMLASVVTYAPRSKVASAALLEIKAAHQLFEKAAKYGGRAVKFRPILQRIVKKAEKTFQDTHAGILNARDIFTPTKSEDTQDDLAVFSGKTSTVVSDATPSPHPSGSESESVKSESTKFSNSTPPMPSFVGAHPGLISDLKDFETNIDQRIQQGTLDVGMGSVYEADTPPQPVQDPQPQLRSQNMMEQQHYMGHSGLSTQTPNDQGPYRMHNTSSYELSPSYSAPHPSSHSGSHSGSGSNQYAPPPVTMSGHSQPSPPSMDQYDQPMPEYSQPYYVRQVQDSNMVYSGPEPAPDIQYHYSHVYQRPDNPQHPHSLPPQRQQQQQMPPPQQYSPPQSQQPQMYAPPMSAPAPSYHFQPQSTDHYPNPTTVLEQQQQQQAHVSPTSNMYQTYGDTYNKYQPPSQPPQRLSHRPSLNFTYLNESSVNDDPNVQATWNNFFRGPVAVPGMPDQR